MFAMTPWVRRLLIANVVIFLLSTSVMPYLFRDFVLIPSLLLQRPWTGLSYMFLHGGLSHIAFNMLGLFFFGPRIEQRLGGNDFLKLYFFAGFGGAAFSFLFEPSAPVVGASGAIYGVLLAFAMFWPRERIYIWGVLPVEARILVAIAVGSSVYLGFGGTAGNTAHFAHLGGLVFAFAYVKWREWRRGSARRDFQRRLEGSQVAPSVGLSDKAQLARWQGIDVSSLHEINRDEVRALLDKAKTQGTRGLTTSERQFLDRMVASSGSR